MDDAHFDALTRRLSSRRTALAGLLGGVAAVLGLSELKEASAHNLVPACQRIDDPVKRRKCLARARRHQRRRHSCKPRPLAVTCANRCGRTLNSCRKAVTCTCPAGKLCLANKGCTRTCSIASPFCPPGCTCGVPVPEAPGAFACFPNTVTDCAQISLPCVTSANCPRGFYCGTVVCPGGPSWCIPNCPI